MPSKPSRITSRDNALLVRLRKLARHPGDYRKHGIAMLEGEHLCEAWARRGEPKATQAILSESAWQSGRFVDLVDGAAATIIVADSAMSDLGSLETPVAVIFVVPLPAQQAIQADAPSVILDRVQDAGNVGSILRSAAAFGFRQVIALKGTASLWSGKVLRAGMGAHAGLRLIEGMAEESLADLAVPLLGTDSHAGAVLENVALPWPCAWVFGNEGAGTSPTLAGRCSKVVRIPQPGGQESLNVAAAAAICLHESMRPRVAVSAVAQRGGGRGSKGP